MNVPAITFDAPGEVSLRSLEVQSPGAGEVQVATRYSGISAGTEGWALRNRFTWSPTPFPCVPGYQRTGTVQAIGRGVKGLEIGQAVMAASANWDPASTGGVWPHSGAGTSARPMYRGTRCIRYRLA